MNHVLKQLLLLAAALAALFLYAGGSVAQDDEEDCVWVDGECIEGYIYVPEYVSVEDVKKAVDTHAEDIVIVDTADPLIYEDERIPGAINYPWVHEIAQPVDLPRDKTLVLYCACVAEEDSIDMAQKLNFAGFVNVKVLKGGWFKWLEMGYPTVGNAVAGN